MSLQESVGATIRDLRKNLGYSQETFSDVVGLHRTYMGSIERGERNPTLKNLERIAVALDIKLSSVFLAAEARRK